MPYRIYCRKTWKLLAVYQNEETLKTLDHSRCSYEKVKEKNLFNERATEAKIKESIKSTTSYLSAGNAVALYSSMF